ncbi:hypothetical protein [Chitinophaga nivalis]|uniref:FecR protein domain-containing protein n=1 Tax=Chitinophaga nivalis TaxID=2991709 RepID=A0ABT3IQY3_9BACT|nr:hypothetical protein [Chitinophaga nivalis]MCW3464019.1 hypothetical protein [Chitinophaga nivalis]MCW3486291.1 hypothetical protein [Chitinophaga nivalis]
MKRTIIQIVCTIISALICLFVLVTVTGIPNDKKNGFNRNWLPMQVRLLRAQPLPFAAERLFGTGDRLYLSEPAHQSVYRLDDHLHIQDTIALHINRQLKPPVTFFAVGNNVYMHEYNSGQLFSPAIGTVKLSQGPFLKSIQLSDSIVVIRGFKEGSFQPVFKRINIRSQEEYTADLLSEKSDAGVSTDGILCSNGDRDRLFYIPYFENGIYCMDSKLQLRYQQRTIDTIFNSGIQVAVRDKGATQKLYAAAPRAKVNKRAFANNQRLFVESDLLADNEKTDTFNLHPVLDTYQIENGSYAGSFYLPLDKRKVLSYYVNGMYLYVLLKDQVVAYELSYAD